MNSYQVDDIFRLKKKKGGYRVYRVTGCYYGATDQESVIGLKCLDVCDNRNEIFVPVIMMNRMEWVDPVKQIS